MSYSRDALISLLQRHDIGPTHQRLEIAQVLFSRGEHLAAEQILALVNEHRAETSKATVYNTLNLFRDRGLIREVIVDPKRVFYDPNTQPHHHLYNVDSGEITDIPADDLVVSGLPELPPDMVTTGVDIIVRMRARQP
ncbi:MAG: transcriptional repressor [Betaproteobacteria bacterium]|nr:transcriptional repressor [Betaproteobacteria bacterium]MDH5343366.1 transcriptional repressor [Betaproteobacteria bacterium]